MNGPSFLLAQLSDPHIGATWAGEGSVDGLAAAVEAVRAIRPHPDAVLVTGDLADHATDEEYELLRKLLGPLGVPFHVLPGNHDDRGALRRHFGLPGAGGEPVQYSVDLGPLRLVALDTTIPGEDAGALGPERLDWLDRALTAAPEQLTLVAMHHPPLLTGVPVWDAIGLAAANRQALGTVLERHPQVQRVVGGHFHRAIVGRSALVAPSTYTQFLLDFTPDEIELSADPAGFVLHTVVDGELTSHFHTVQA